MYRIRFHGRGGQGMKSASRILGTAFFLAGYEVQDAPRYGAERRGAPIFAYVRASREPIYERGIVRNPDLVIVADESLVALPAAGVQQGLDEHTVLLINSDQSAEVWQERLNLKGRVVTFTTEGWFETRHEERYVGAVCVGAAMRLLGVLDEAVLEKAIVEELGKLGGEVVAKNIAFAKKAYALMAADEGCVSGGRSVDAEAYAAPQWVELPFEDASVSAPVVHGGATSENVPTGLWRTMRPEIDYEHCNHCWWNCSTFCPDSAINVEKDGRPVIDYDHCKGCLICAAICPLHAIAVLREAEPQPYKKREES